MELSKIQKKMKHVKRIMRDEARWDWKWKMRAVHVQLLMKVPLALSPPSIRPPHTKLWGLGWLYWNSDMKIWDRKRGDILSWGVGRSRAGYWRPRSHVYFRWTPVTVRVAVRLPNSRYVFEVMDFLKPRAKRRQRARKWLRYDPKEARVRCLTTVAERASQRYLMINESIARRHMDGGGGGGDRKRARRARAADR